MSSDTGRRSTRGRSPTSSNSAALQAAGSSTHRHGADRSRSRSPRYGAPRDNAPRSVSTRSSTSHAGSSRGGASRDGVSPNGTPRPDRNVKISHILIKHRQSRRPIDSNDRPVTRTKDQAMAILIGIHEKISKDLITFADAAVSYSECRSARRQGDVQQQFQTGRVVKAFEEAAFSLAPGQMSYIIESKSGYHILQRRE